MTTELGLKIQEEILLRSQVIDLIRCKSVCKSWNSLISSDGFVRSHLKRQHRNATGDTRIIVSGASSMRLKNWSLSRRQSQCKVIGSSNGLVCLSCYGFDFIVVNPSTHEVKQLLNLPDYPYDVHIHASGFGYDSSIDDYKVVIGSRCNPNDFQKFNVLELKTNIWRSIDVESDHEYLEGNGILCKGAIHWLHRDIDKTRFVIVSFVLSKEVFKKTRLTKFDDEWILGSRKNHLCVFSFANTDLEANEISAMRNDQVSGYEANKITIDNDVPQKNILSGHVHIWLLEEGSASAPELVRSIDPSHNIYIPPDYHEHIPLYTYSECNYNYDDHVYVKSLVSPHKQNGSCNEERVKRTRQNVERKSLVSSDSDDDERKIHVFHIPDKARRGKSRRKSHVSFDSEDTGRRRVERKRREIHVFQSSDKGRAKSKWQSHRVDMRRREMKMAMRRDTRENE